MTSGLTAVMGSSTRSSPKEEVMLEPTQLPEIELNEPEARDDEEVLVHEWRIERLLGLGVAAVLAERFAALVDWHDIAALVERGCPPALRSRSSAELVRDRPASRNPACSAARRRRLEASRLETSLVR
jgi:hypothetical protein